MSEYGAIVIGLGAMGSATAYQLAKAGVKVLGFDQFNPPHKRGSSHGETRITRLATSEGEEYVPLVKRSHELWREIEKDSGLDILEQTGVLIMVGGTGFGQSRGKDFLENLYELAEKNDIKHEKLSTGQIRERFPAFSLTGDEQGYYEYESGFVRPENAVQAQLDLAKKYGATLNANEKVLSYDSVDGLVTVTTDKGTYTADQLIITAGSWLKDLLPEKATVFRVHRQVLHWFDIADKIDYQQFRDLPVFIWAFGNGLNDGFYGFPAIEGPTGGVKVANAVYEAQTTPDDIDREVPDSEIQAMYEHYVARQFPGLTSRSVKTATCLYTNTPDGKFVIDFHPQHKNIIIASPCSGHGFKHSAAIGEVLAQLTQTGTSNIDISKFSFARF